LETHLSELKNGGLSHSFRRNEFDEPEKRLAAGADTRPLITSTCAILVTDYQLNQSHSSTISSTRAILVDVYRLNLSHSCH
jgi:hypothetical protein